MIDLTNLLFSSFGCCGCTDDTKICKSILTILNWAGSDMSKRLQFDKIPNVSEGEFYIVAGILNDLDFIEHGTAIRCAWITDEGRELIKVIETYLASVT